MLDPISTKGLTADDVTDLTSSTRELMLAELIKISPKTKSQPVAVPAAAPVSTGGKSSGVDAQANGH